MNTEQSSFLVFAGQQGFAVVSEHDCFMPVADDAMIPPAPPKPVTLAEHTEIPPEYAALYQQYAEKVEENKLPDMMFIALDYGHQIIQLQKKDLLKWTLSLLTCGIENNVQQAVEAMSRTLGIWRMK